MIKLLFSANKTIVSRTIRIATWSKYSHVDFILSNDIPDLLRHNIYRYPGFYKFPIVLGAVVGKGVSLREMSQVLESSTQYAIAKVDVSDKAIDYAISQLGKKYDYSAILGFPTRSDIENQNKWFCSELVAWAIERSGTDLFNEPISRITPRDLAIHPYVEIIESRS